MKHVFAVVAFSFLVPLALAAACYRDSDPNLPPEPDAFQTYTATLEETDAAQSPCGKACAHLRELRCPEGLPSPGGVTCYQWCSRATATGILLEVPECVIGSRDVPSLKSCRVRCQQ